MVLICTVNFLLIIILLLQKKFNSIKAVAQETNMTMNKCYLIGKHGKVMFNIHSNEMYRKLQEANMQNILYIKPTLCTLYAAVSSKMSFNIVLPTDSTHPVSLKSPRRCEAKLLIQTE